MSKHRRRLSRSILVDTRGTASVEYVLLVSLIAIVCVSVWTRFGLLIQARVDGATELFDRLPTS